jgi:hypothetical protein
VAVKIGRARAFGAQLKAWLQAALTLWHESREGKAPHYKVVAEALQAAMTYHLRDWRLQDLDNQRLLNALG